MARYFLDTGALLGITFLHDLWRSESERLFATKNTVYTSDAVVFEYCNRDQSNTYESADIDWETEEGRFGEKLSKVRAAQVNLDLRLQTYDDSELDLESLVDAFLSEVGIKDEIYPEKKIGTQIRPNIRQFLKSEIGDKEITCKVAREAMDTLCDTIQYEAREARRQLRDLIKRGPERESDWKEVRERLSFVDGKMDKIILCDVSHLENKNILQKVITADKSDLYGQRERIHTVLGIKVLFIKDELAENALPQEKKDAS